jgi:hypothetical protein
LGFTQSWTGGAHDEPGSGQAAAQRCRANQEALREGGGRDLRRTQDLVAELRAAGFTVPTVIPVAPALRDAQAADKILGLERTTQRAAAAGYFTEGAARRWLDHLAGGPFLAAVTFYIVVAES